MSPPAVGLSLAPHSQPEGQSEEAGAKAEGEAEGGASLPKSQSMEELEEEPEAPK